MDLQDEQFGPDDLFLTPPWPGPDRYTLRAVAELDVALGTGVVVDAAHAVVSDGAARAFGPGWQSWLPEALAAEGAADLRELVADEELLGRVLGHLHERMRSAAAEDDDAPPAPDPDLVWTAHSPRHTRQRFRRAGQVRRRAVAMVQPRRRDVAGERARRS
ncbi:hypothetical protein [Modestobacter sp. SYSU DS0657]